MHTNYINEQNEMLWYLNKFNVFKIQVFEFW